MSDRIQEIRKSILSSSPTYAELFAMSRTLLDELEQVTEQRDVQYPGGLPALLREREQACDELDKLQSTVLSELNRIGPCCGHPARCHREGTTATGKDGLPHLCDVCDAKAVLTELKQDELRNQELQKRIAELEAALVPFALYARVNDNSPSSDSLPVAGGTVGPVFIRLGDCRKARAVLEEKL